MLSLLISVVAAIYFVLFADVSWVAVAVMAAASSAASWGSTLPGSQRSVLRWRVIAFGVVVGVRLFVAS